MWIAHRIMEQAAELNEIKKELDSILFVIDAQGFYHRRQFYPRVISLVSDTCYHNFEIDTELSESDFRGDEKFSFKYVQKFIHGLDLRPIRLKFGFKCHTKETFKAYLEQLYNSLKTDKQYSVAVKNSQLKPYISSMNFPIIDLEDPKYKCPKLPFFDIYFGEKKYWFCGSHSSLPESKEKQVGYRCSLRKATYIWRWIQNTIKDYETKISTIHRGDSAEDGSKQIQLDSLSCRIGFERV